MGDVALLLPVIRSLVAAHNDVEVTIVTRPLYAPFFYDLERVKVFPADVDHTYNGLFGMRELFRTLIRKDSYDVIIDAHDHMRTIVLRSFFKVFFTRVIVFNKGRREKQLFSRRRNKVTRKLPHTIERYHEAFQRAGLSFPLLPGPHFILNDSLQSAAHQWLERKGLEKKSRWIGIAPFAAHATKIWPLENYKMLIESVIRATSAHFFLFGGGAKEIKYFESLVSVFPDHCTIAAGDLKIRQEIALMKRMDLMVCVDSSNMHLASLAGVPVLSIWGGTHPDVGFAPVGPDNSIIQVSTDELRCRPCSVYGRSSCYVGGFPCLTRITVEMITDQIIRKLSS